jgi:F420-0:gamma-glutamyl ligase-like protein
VFWGLAATYIEAFPRVTACIAVVIIRVKRPRIVPQKQAAKHKKIITHIFPLHYSLLRCDVIWSGISVPVLLMNLLSAS